MRKRSKEELEKKKEIKKEKKKKQTFGFPEGDALGEEVGAIDIGRLTFAVEAGEVVRATEEVGAEALEPKEGVLKVGRVGAEGSGHSPFFCLYQTAKTKKPERATAKSIPMMSPATKKT